MKKLLLRFLGIGALSISVITASCGTTNSSKPIQKESPTTTQSTNNQPNLEKNPTVPGIVNHESIDMISLNPVMITVPPDSELMHKINASVDQLNHLIPSDDFVIEDFSANDQLVKDTIKNSNINTNGLSESDIDWVIDNDDLADSAPHIGLFNKFFANVSSANIHNSDKVLITLMGGPEWKALDHMNYSSNIKSPSTQWKSCALTNNCDNFVSTHYRLDNIAIYSYLEPQISLMPDNWGHIYNLKEQASTFVFTIKLLHKYSQYLTQILHKEVHIIGHSYGGFILDAYVKEYGHKITYAKAINIMSSRLLWNESVAKTRLELKNTYFFPYDPAYALTQEDIANYELFISSPKTFEELLKSAKDPETLRKSINKINMEFLQVVASKYANGNIDPTNPWGAANHFGDGTDGKTRLNFIFGTLDHTTLPILTSEEQMIKAMGGYVYKVSGAHDLIVTLFDPESSTPALPTFENFIGLLLRASLEPDLTIEEFKNQLVRLIAPNSLDVFKLLWKPIDEILPIGPGSNQDTIIIDQEYFRHGMPIN